MSLTARDVMSENVITVPPDMPLPELERAFLAHKFGGFPVVDDGRLVGTVSRSDIVRQLCVEQSLAEMVSDYDRADAGFQNDPAETLDKIGHQVGERIEQMHVKDVMIRKPITVLPNLPIAEVAQTFAENGIHRVTVVETDQLLGVLCVDDLVRLIADGRLHE